MIREKRVTLFCGHYGSGKTNLAVNYAMELGKKGKKVLVADLDIINPYFRTKDSAEEFEKVGIELIASEYANSAIDVPSLPAELHRISQDKEYFAVLDVGGDERGSVALGRFSQQIKEENDYEMIFVVNFYRHHTLNPEEAYEMLKMIEKVCGLEFTAIINNSCLGIETTAKDVLNTDEAAKELSQLSGLPLVATSAKEDVAKELSSLIDDVFPLSLQEKYFRVTGIK